MSGTVIKRCTCKHAYQDKRYGRGKRVHNVGEGNKGNVPEVCTVCGAGAKGKR